MDYAKKAMEMHEQLKGKLEVVSKVKIETRDDLSTAYTPVSYTHLKNTVILLWNSGIYSFFYGRFF